MKKEEKGDREKEKNTICELQLSVFLYSLVYCERREKVTNVTTEMLHVTTWCKLLWDSKQLQYCDYCNYYYSD